MKQLTVCFQIALVLTSATLLLCCDSSTTEGHRSSEEGQSTPSELQVADDDRIVATVNGVPITASRVAQLARETGRSPREVVDGLIDFELLAAEAAKRGFSDHWEVRYAEHQALVQHYLDHDFEPNARPEDMPESVLRLIYEEKIRSFVHPRLYKVSHILVEAQEGTASSAKRREAHALAKSLREEALSANNVAAFKAVALEHQGEKGFELRFESFVVHEKANLVRPFIDATLALEKAGDISEPVDTRFGTHIIFVEDVRETSDRSFAEAEDEIRTKAHPFWLKREFLAHTDELRLATTVKGYAGPKRRVAGP